MRIDERDRLASHLYLDFFGDDDLTSERIKSMSRKLYEQLKAYRRQNRKREPES